MKTAPVSETKYSPPKLIIYGDMVKKTASGSVSNPETAGNQTTAKHI
ncbi:hypothetical protein [Sphingomonas hankyongi]|uniref:Lasso RiPP family leader peptide-containing protein n=1 Tax=Sphingomonas hankyongi TaxID=2908209 RepID=A0ABT0S3E0_9SPHN|nr:hypothetical protein [Sphingomonas hankyongi]MCL6730138.1 hypothetical protein [Sphingomonas hankyongi]